MGVLSRFALARCAGWNIEVATLPQWHNELGHPRSPVSGSRFRPRHWNILGPTPTYGGMGKALLPPGTITIPALARAMGLRHTTLYSAISAGRGPTLRHVTPAPGNYYRGKRSNAYVTIPDAIAWLQGRRDSARWSDLITHLRVEQIVACVRAGVPLPRPHAEPYISAHRRNGNERPGVDLPVYSVPGH